VSHYLDEVEAIMSALLLLFFVDKLAQYYYQNKISFIESKSLQFFILPNFNPKSEEIFPQMIRFY
jgi:hypothetical protein